MRLVLSGRSRPEPPGCRNQGGGLKPPLGVQRSREPYSKDGVGGIKNRLAAVEEIEEVNCYFVNEAEAEGFVCGLILGGELAVKHISTDAQRQPLAGPDDICAIAIAPVDNALSINRAQWLAFFGYLLADR